MRKELEKVIRELLVEMEGKSFSTADVMVLLAHRYPDVWKDACAQYGEGGRGCGYNKSVRTYVGQILSRARKDCSGLDYSYIKSHGLMNWGSRYIAFWTYDPYGSGTEILNNSLENDLSCFISGRMDNLPEVDEGGDVLSSVLCRLGQGKFRKKQIKYWKKCCVTGCNSHDVLRASHIKPWSACSSEEKLDVYNGFLLIPNLDVLFDRGLMTIKCSGKVVYSDLLSIETRRTLGLSDDWKVKVEREHRRYLEYHHENVFLKVVKRNR